MVSNDAFSFPIITSDVEMLKYIINKLGWTQILEFSI